MDEFTVSQTAARRGIPNTPGQLEELAIRALCKEILDPLEDELQTKLGKSIVINSGYRSPKVNRAVGGAKNSQHTKGEAVDLIVPGCSVELVVALIQQLNLPFDQLINEFGSWVHVSFKLSGSRREVLKARKSGRKVIYTKVA